MTEEIIPWLPINRQYWLTTWASTNPFSPAKLECPECGQEATEEREIFLEPYVPIGHNYFRCPARHKWLGMVKIYD